MPTALAVAIGAVMDFVWTSPVLGDRLGRDGEDPPMTRFVAEQLSTAHWFDQRETRALLGWAPRISIDEGLVELARSYGR